MKFFLQIIVNFGANLESLVAAAAEELERAACDLPVVGKAQKSRPHGKISIFIIKPVKGF